MNSLAKKFQFGFEIEGAFSVPLIKKIAEESKKDQEENKIDSIHFQSDCSVHIPKLKDTEFLNPNTDRLNGKVRKIIREHPVIKSYRGNAEMTFGVFSEIKTLEKYLTFFNENLYQWNKSCGLHLHISPDRKEIKEENKNNYKGRILDHKLLHEIQDFGWNLCQHTKDRKNDERGYHYCQNYKGLKETRREIEKGTKYKFLRNHQTLNTLEFRFFPPCRHKTENVMKFLNFLFEKLENVKNYKRGRKYLPEEKDTDLGEIQIGGKKKGAEHMINQKVKMLKKYGDKETWNIYKKGYRQELKKMWRKHKRYSRKKMELFIRIPDSINIKKRSIDSLIRISAKCIGLKFVESKRRRENQRRIRKSDQENPDTIEFGNVNF